MAYEAFNYQKPDPDVDDGTAAFTNTRANLLALRDMVIAGMPFGWEMEALNSAETGPPTNAYAPEKIRWKNGIERVRETYTWSGDIPVKTVYEYSNDGGTSYSIIKTVNYTTDGSGYITGISQS